MSVRFPSAGLPATAVALFERVFLNAPDRAALIFLENGDTEAVRLTRGELRQRVMSVAATLQQIAAPGDRALLVYPSGADFAIGYLACLYAGLAPVPCYPPSRNRVDHRLAGIASSSESRLVLTSDKVGASPGPRFEGYPALKDVQWLSTSGIDLAMAERWSPPAIGGTTTALIQYTSGSTSAPRGVVVSHTNLLASFRDMDFGHDDDSVMVTWLPLFHDLGLIFGLLQPLADGFPCVLMPPAAFLQQPIRWLRALTKYRGTHAAAPNFAFDLCASRISGEAAAELDLSKWTFALNAAEPVRADTIDRFSKHFAPAGFNRRTFSPGFGLAEATLRVTATPAAELAEMVSVDPEALKQHRVVLSRESNAITLVASGTAVAETFVTIVDPETLRPCEANRVGEIWVGGRTVAQGYFQDADATAATFDVRLDGHAAPFLRTGDLGFIRNGWLYITGRLKDVIILRGLNYYPQDLERTIEQSHPALAAAGAAAFSIEVDGDERLAVVAEVARTHRRSVDTAAVYDAMHRALADAHGVAIERIALIDPHGLPKTSSGKVRRKACRESLLTDGLPLIGQWQRPATVAAAPPVETDRTFADIHKWLVTTFARQFGCAPSAIDSRASLAQYGLDSITAVELSEELEQIVGRPVAATVFYDYPTIDALSGHLSGTKAQTAARGHSATGTGAIAVVGLGCRFPGADDPQAFWDLLRNGGNAVGPLAPQRAGRGAHAPGGYLNQVDGFDAEFFGISPREAERMDPQQRLVLEVGWEALEDAGLAPDSIAGSLTGVFIGIANSDYSRLSIDAGAGNIYLGTGSSLTITANRLSYVLDLKGPSLAIDTACSSSLVAIALASASLRRGECDMALAGGVNLILSHDYTQAFQAAGMLSADGRCKAFDAAADGYVRGEGAGIVVLKTLDRAERDGDRILAVIRGVATNQDGRSAGLTAPNGPSQQAVITAALRDADLPASRVSYVEAHGTGTPLGDPIELNALAAALADGRAAGAVCRVGSVKTNIGHLEAAAGIAGVIKTVLSLRHREIPASLHCREINPRIELAGRVAINTAHQPWTVVDDLPRVAGVSSFGFGGSNAHVVLEEYPTRPTAANDPRPCVLTLSARNQAALDDTADRYAALLESEPAAAFADVAFTSNVARTAMNERLALVASSAAEAAGALRQWRRGDGASRARVRTGRVDSAATPGVVFLYTGQGANYPGMGLDLYRAKPAFARAIDECSEVVRPVIGTSIAKALEDVSPDATANMLVSQTCLFAIEYALTKLWAAWGVRPAAVIGHSLGEFAAAHAAGSISLESALALVTTRAQLLQSIEGDGAMIAAAASHDVIASAIEPWATDLSIAAVNGATNVVFSGRRRAAADAVARLTALGIRHTALTVAQAFHSPLVDGILDRFAIAAASVTSSAPHTPFCSTVTGTWLTTGPDAEYWRLQLRAPVFYMRAIETVRADGFDTFLEVGPHPTLATLGEQVASSRRGTWAASLHRDRSGATQIRHAIADLWTAGVPVDWRAIHTNGAAKKTSVPSYPFQRTSYWIGKSRHASPIDASASGHDQHTYEVQWVERAATHAAAATGLNWVLFSDEGGVGESVAQSLRQRGDRVAVIRRSDIAAETPADYGRALSQATQTLGAVDRVVHLRALDSPSESSTAALREAVRGGAMSALYAIQALETAHTSGRIWFVTRRATAAGAGLSESGVLQSALSGIGRNLAVEHPDRSGALIDLDDDAKLDHLLAEITADVVVDAEVSFRDGQRLVSRIAPATLPEHHAAIDPAATYLITGGLGALGLAVAKTLVETGARHLVLVSRGGVTNDDRRAAIAALERDGAVVDTPAIDVTDDAAVKALVDRVSASGRLAGVVHAAGEAGFATMRDMTEEAFGRVFRAKAEGALVLARATASLPLEFFICVSSMSSVWAGEGQAHYVAANHFVDVLAHRLRQSGRPATSIGFGPLRGGLMPAAIAERLTKTGVATWDMSRAASLILQTAGSGCTHAVAVELDWQVFGTKRSTARAAATTTAVPEGSLFATLSSADPGDREHLLGQAVLLEAAGVLGMNAADWGDARRGFFDMGMDSLTAVELRKRFEVLLGRSLPVTLVFDHANIEALRRALLTVLFADETPAAKPRPAAAPALATASTTSPDDSLAATLERLKRLVAGQ